MRQWIARLNRPGVRNAAIALYVLCVACLIAVYLSVSLSKVKYAAYMRAEPALETGRPLAARGQVLDPNMGKPFTRGEVLLRLREPGATPHLGAESGASDDTKSALNFDAKDAFDWGRATIEPSGYFHISDTLSPDVAPGDYVLSMLAKVRADRADPHREEIFVTEVPVRVNAPQEARDGWPVRTERLAPDKKKTAQKPVQSSQGPIRIDLLPGDGEVARGLKSDIYLRTSLRKTGEPVSVSVQIEKTFGLTENEVPETVQTDAMGLARVELIAATDLSWTVTAAEPGVAKPAEVKPAQPDAEETAEKPSQAKLSITTAPSQFALQLRDVLAVPAQTVDGRVDSLFRDGGLMVDLYREDAWIDAGVFGVGAEESGIRVSIPENNAPKAEEDAAGESDRVDLYRVQVYRSIYGTRGAWDIDYLVGARGHSLRDYRQAARALAGYLARHTEDPYFDWLAASDSFELSTSRRELRGWIDAMLMAIPRHFAMQPALIDDLERSQLALDARVDAVQSRLKILTAMALFIGLVVVLYLVFMGVRGYRAQHQMLQDVEFEMSLTAGEDAPEHELSRDSHWERWVVGAQIFIVLGTFFLFGLGLLMLLSYF